MQASKDGTSPTILSDNHAYMPWGATNLMPFDIIDLIESDETLATCQMFNTEVCYGSGLQYDTATEPTTTPSKILFPLKWQSRMMRIGDSIPTINCAPKVG